MGKSEYFNLPNLHHLLQNFGKMGDGLDNWVSANCWHPDYPNDRYVLNEWKGALTGNEEAIHSFAGVCLTALKSLTNRDLRVFFHDSDYELSRFRREKTAIFFITPPEQQQYYSFVTSLFFRCLFNECMRREHLRGRSLPAYILYDEFGNSYVPDFVSVANTARGYRVSLSIILQTIAQLEMRYGKASAQSIQGAMNTNMCLSGSDPTTAHYFSDLSGKVREEQLRSIDSPNVDHREYNLLNPNEVRTMEDNQALIISKNRNPVLLPVKAYYEVGKWKKATRFPAYQVKGTHNRNNTHSIPLVSL